MAYIFFLTKLFIVWSLTYFTETRERKEDEIGEKYFF